VATIDEQHGKALMVAFGNETGRQIVVRVDTGEVHGSVGQIGVHSNVAIVRKRLELMEVVDNEKKTSFRNI
jgi:hypothetical protein